MSVKLRSKLLSDGSESFYLDIYFKGKRDYEFLGIKIKSTDTNRKQKREIAEAKRSKRELELLANYHDLPKSFSGNDDFLEYFEKNMTDYNSVTVYRNFKIYVNDTLGKNTLPFKIIDEKLIEGYRDYLNSKIKNSTVWAYILKLKSAFNRAVKEQLILRNPAKNVKIKLNEIERVYLTEKELKKLINAKSKLIDIEVKKAFIFSCFTGLRISDVYKLTWSQIKEGKLFFTQTKTKGVEYMPLSSTAKKFLYMNVNKKKINLSEKVFKLKSESTTARKLRLWKKIAKLDKKLNYHISRHTFATLALSSGIDIYTVSKMMGHKSVKITEIYAKIINKTVEKAITKLPEL